MPPTVVAWSSLVAVWLPAGACTGRHGMSLGRSDDDVAAKVGLERAVVDVAFVESAGVDVEVVAVNVDVDYGTASFVGDAFVCTEKAAVPAWLEKIAGFGAVPAAVETAGSRRTKSSNVQREGVWAHGYVAETAMRRVALAENKMAVVEVTQREAVESWTAVQERFVGPRLPSWRVLRGLEEIGVETILEQVRLFDDIVAADAVAHWYEFPFEQIVGQAGDTAGWPAIVVEGLAQ